MQDVNNDSVMVVECWEFSVRCLYLAPAANIIGNSEVLKGACIYRPDALDLSKLILKFLDCSLYCFVNSYLLDSF